MAKLPKKVAERVNQAEGKDFSLLPEGTYTGKLVEVDASKSGDAGPYWSWEFDLQDEGYENRKLWVNTSLSEKADWKMKEVFEAFGYDADTDTDELVGQEVLLIVSQRVIEKGKLKGQLGNNVDQCLPLDGGDGEGGGDDGDDVFD